MKIPILPEWTEERHQYLFAGIELAAFKHQGEKWWVKTSRCNLCGLCCENISDGWEFGVDENGVCAHLETVGSEKYCDFGSARPFSCSIGQGRDRVPPKDCTELFEEID